MDPLILMRVIRAEAHRRISWLIAEKSMKRRFIGWAAGTMGAVSVGRALDSVRPAEGRVYLPDPIGDPTLVRGVGTRFDSRDFQVGGLLVLPKVDNVSANAEILDIRGPEEIRLKKPFKGPVAYKQLTGRDDITEEGLVPNGHIDGVVEGKQGRAEGFEGTGFRIAPKVDQTKVYNIVFEHLNRGGCVGIFPEGGSHDRTELLPLKGTKGTTAGPAVAGSLTSRSRRGHHGARRPGGQSRLRAEDRTLRDELLSRSQVPFTGRGRVRHARRSTSRTGGDVCARREAGSGRPVAGDDIPGSGGSHSHESGLRHTHGAFLHGRRCIASDLSRSS